MSVDQVVSAVKTRETRINYYTMMRNYYAGEHQLRFASNDFQTKFAEQVAGLRLNICKPVASVFVDKLEIESWGDNEETVELGLSRLQGMVHREMVRCGDAYVLVWNNQAGKPIPRYLRADEIVPHVAEDDPSVLDMAVRLWIDRDRYGRAMVIDETGAERYRTTAPLPEGYSKLPQSPSSWVEMDDEDGPWVSHDFGAVPVCWFRREADDTDAFGVSVLDDVVSLQDALNKNLADLLVLSETYSRPFWYLLNFRPTNVDNPAMAAQEWAQAVAGLPDMRKPDPKFRPGEQQVVTHDGPGPFGQLDPPDLSRLISLLQDIKLHAAGVVGVPSFYFTQISGDVPSGESLKVLSSRLTSAVKNLQRETGPVWRGVGELLGLETVIRWADPMPESEQVKLQNAALKRDLGVPLVQVFTDLGYEKPEDLAVKAMQERQEQSTIAARAFAEGNILGV